MRIGAGIYRQIPLSLTPTLPLSSDLDKISGARKQVGGWTAGWSRPLTALSKRIWYSGEYEMQMV